MHTPRQLTFARRFFAASSIVVFAACWASAAMASDWMFRPGRYTHDPTAGGRVAQYSRSAPAYRIEDPTYRESGYRHYRSSLPGINDNDWLHIVETWGGGEYIRPYGEWARPYRAGATPFGPWGNPQGPWTAPFDSWSNPYGLYNRYPFPWALPGGGGFGGGFGGGGFGGGGFGGGHDDDGDGGRGGYGRRPRRGDPRFNRGGFPLRYYDEELGWNRLGLDDGKNPWQRPMSRMHDGRRPHDPRYDRPHGGGGGYGHGAGGYDPRMSTHSGRGPTPRHDPWPDASRRGTPAGSGWELHSGPGR